MNGPKPRILVVDDTPANIKVLSEVLRHDYELSVATDGDQALELASQQPPDLVLLDIMMPGMDGYEVCRRLKANPATAQAPVIFVTAMTREGDEAKGLDLGAVDYVTKPFRPSLLQSRVRNHLELKRHRDHLEELVRERTAELSLTREVTIDTLADLAETRDPETGGHIKRTKNYVRALATRLRREPEYAPMLSDEVIELLYVSAPLHDIGKVGVPDAILLKPGKLTDEEMVEMRKHTIYGAEALSGAMEKLGENSFLRLAREVALSHHEKWDGTGYPGGLSGTDIPLAGRLMIVADIYDALVSRRVYKPPFSQEKTLGIMAEHKGTFFDPLVADCFWEIRDEFRQIALEFADFEEERQELSKPA